MYRLDRCLPVVAAGALFATLSVSFAAGAPALARAGASGNRRGIADASQQLFVGLGVRALVLAEDEEYVSLWAAYPGGLADIAPDGRGRLKVTDRITLPGVVPSSLAFFEADDDMAVADTASNSVLVLHGPYGGKYKLTQRLAVGENPVSLASGDFDSDVNDDLVVANRASGDLSVFLGTGKEQPLRPRRRIPVGDDPTAVTTINPYPETPHFEDLAVTRAASNSLSILRNDGHGNFNRREDVAVGMGPIGLMPDGYVPVLTVNQGGGSVSIVPVTPKRAGPARTLQIPGAAGGALSAITAGDLTQDETGVGAVFDAASGHATVLARSFALDQPVSSYHTGASFSVAGRPSAAAVADIGGDQAPDLVTADPATGMVSVRITPGDRMLALDRTAAHVTAGAGYVVWSHRRTTIGYGLARWHAGTVRDIGPGGWHGPAISRIGRGRRGQPVVTYGRCGKRRCAAYAYELRTETEHRLRIRVPRGCWVKTVEQWRAAFDYWLRPRQGARCRQTGAWVSWPHTAPQRLGGRHIQSLGDVRRTSVGWIGLQQFPNIWRLRAMERRRGAHTRVLMRSSYCDVDCQSDIYGTGPNFDDKDIYVTYDYGFGEIELHRSQPSGRQRCRTSWGTSDDATRGIPTDDLAVANGRIYYADGRGVFAVDPARVRFRHRHCT